MNGYSSEKSIGRQNYQKLTDPLSGNRTDINSAAGRIAIYSAGGPATPTSPRCC